MKKLTLIGLVMALMALFAGTAVAQDGPTVTAEPVAAAGANDVNISGSGFTGGIALFVLPCADAGGDVENFLGADDPGSLCDTANLTPVTADDDGNFTATVSGWDIPAEGLVFVAGDAGQTEVGVGVITVGDGGDAAADEEEAPAEEEAAPAADSDLANTGAETGVMVGLGVALLGLGVVSTRAGRRLGDR